MSAVHDSVEIVNAAANAITTAESRVQAQPYSTVRKRRWGNCLNLYWCFGSYKQTKRVGHALLVPEPVVQNITSSHSIVEDPNNRSSSTIIFPFIAPPSSPASFLQSGPPSSTQTPNGPLSITDSVKTAQIYTIGPYAHETQLVSPPVFSTYTTEPSTACFTPPPETVQMTSPSSPEVPFAQLLLSSLARNRRNSGTNYNYHKYSLSQCEFKPYQCESNSGTSSPFPDKNLKFAGDEQFSNYNKWGSRVGSGSLTPNNWGSRLGSGALTPSGGISRLGSGALTPNNNGDSVPEQGNTNNYSVIESQISEVASLANSGHHELGNNDAIIDHRVSFELFGEDIPTCVIREAIPSREVLSSANSSHKASACEKNETGFENKDEDNYCSSRYSNEDALSEVLGMTTEVEGDDFNQKTRSVSLGSSKDFNFNNANGEISFDKSSVDCEWWTSDKGSNKELMLSPQSKWTFFPKLQSGIS